MTSNERNSEPRRFVRRDFVRPRLGLSACIEVEACRYNGDSIPNTFVRRLMEYVEMVPVCPEVEVGLGVPRETIRLVADGDETRLIQPASGWDLTEEMHAFSSEFLDGMGPIDGFILKSGSPSCGLKGINVYADVRDAPPVRHEPGLFARHVLERFGDRAVETEGRLRNYPIRHHFLTRLFALAELRRLGDSPSVSAIVDFQRRHKHLLMTYDQEKMRRLGAIAANREGVEVSDLYESYAGLFREALREPPGGASYVNTLTHMYGHFKDELSSDEREEYFSMIDEYRASRLPLHALIAVVRSWCSRFRYDYFADQSILEPYPRELIMMRDSGKGVDF